MNVVMMQLFFLIMREFLTVFILGSISCTNVQVNASRWSILHQSDYDLKIEIAKVESFNSSYFKNAKMDAVPYNRTLRVLNGTFHVIADVPQKIMVTVKTSKFMSNEYRFFPITFEFDACTEYRHDSFGLKQMFDRYSNLRPCLVPKNIYYLTNALPDFTKFPPHIPYGRYRMDINVCQRYDGLLYLAVYLEIKEKGINLK